VAAFSTILGADVREPVACGSSGGAASPRSPTLAQVETLDCGSLTLPQFPWQRPSPGARMPTLRQVFDLVDPLPRA
jgi:hypothetical protein